MISVFDGITDKKVIFMENQKSEENTNIIVLPGELPAGTKVPIFNHISSMISIPSVSGNK